MVTFDFPLLTRRVKVKFICNVCGELVESEWFSVPSANYDGDNHEDSLCTEDYDVLCPECGEQFTVTVGASIYGGEGWIDELSDDWNVDVEYEQESE